MSRAGYVLGSQLAPRVDKVLIPRTNGRLSTMGIDKVGLVTTTGAKSGQPRAQPLTLLDDGDGLLAIGSNYGRDKHPSWSANLLAHPEATVVHKGERIAVAAHLLDPEEKAAVWDELTQLWPTYESYEARTERDLRVFELRPAAQQAE